MKNMVQKPNSIVHVEIHSNAPEKTKSFLKDVFGWKFEDMPQMNYSMFQPPSAPGGGLQQAENLPAGVLNYVLTEDIENTLRKVTSSGLVRAVPGSDRDHAGRLRGAGAPASRPKGRAKGGEAVWAQGQEVLPAIPLGRFGEEGQRRDFIPQSVSER